MLLSRASLTDSSVWVSVGVSWGIDVLNSLSSGLLVWLSLGYCGMWIKLHLWTWDLGKVGVGDAENHQHAGRSGNFPGHATTPVRMVRTGEAQERPC